MLQLVKKDQATVVAPKQYANATEEVKARLTVAFRALRKEGWVCKSAYWCCQSCGGAALIQECEKKKVTPKGYAFYHQQDNDQLKRRGMVWLAWGSGDFDNKAPKKDREPRDVQLGIQLMQALMIAGLGVKWDGSTGTRIAVTTMAKVHELSED